jgi:cellobiose phosphorylase
LGSRERREVVLILGIVREEKEAIRIRAKYQATGAVEKALAGVRNFWDNYTGQSFLVATPDPDIDRLINIWIKYQHRACMLENLNTGRRGFGVWCPAYPYGGSRTTDVRETGNVPCDLQLVKEDILDTLEHPGPLMLAADLEVRWKSPVSETPLRYPGDGRGLWPYPICWYVKETGDFTFLQTELHPSGRPSWLPKSGPVTVFTAMKGGIDWALSGLSERGLARLNAGYGDWNDALNLISREGKGESILTSLELCYMLKQCVELAEAYGKPEEAATWTRQYERIKSAVNQHAWDGQWYLRAFTDEGNPVGSSRNEAGKIFLSVQALAVLSGVADKDRTAQCLKSVDDLLLTEYGPRACAPPYPKPAYDVGIVGDFGPGWRENAGIWNRTTGWTVMANCLANRASQAFEMYRRASVSNPSKDTERFWLPPYAYPEYYVGAGPDFGRGQFQWCMGKAGTMWRAYVYYILGVRPSFAGLLVDPKIPREWPRFTLRRTFRGATYAIEVANPKRVNFGVKSMEVDGKPVEGNVLPAYADVKTHEVRVVLGA